MELKEIEVIEALKLTGKITGFINTFSDKSEGFNAAMSREHRTLQQSFTRLCLAWIEHVASSDYEFDGRNLQSKETAQVIMQLWRDYQIGQGFTGSTLDLMSKPSGHLGMI
jgi:hypothetical protein